MSQRMLSARSRGIKRNAIWRPTRASNVCKSSIDFAPRSPLGNVGSANPASPKPSPDKERATCSCLYWPPNECNRAHPTTVRRHRHTGRAGGRQAKKRQARRPARNHANRRETFNIRLIAIRHTAELNETWRSPTIRASAYGRPYANAPKWRRPWIRSAVSPAIGTTSSQPIAAGRSAGRHRLNAKREYQKFF